MPDNSPPLDSALWKDWIAFLRAYKNVIEQISQDLSEQGMPTLVEYSVLFGLRHAPEHRLRQVDLSRGVLVSKSRVTRLMNSLVDQGYVNREKTHADKRVTYAVLTQKGLDVFHKATPTFARAFDRYFGSLLAVDDQGELTRLLRPMATQIEPWPREPEAAPSSSRT
jgi:DNA-binding MarR family transcriptional regulator